MEGSCTAVLLREGLRIESRGRYGEAKTRRTKKTVHIGIALASDEASEGSRKGEMYCMHQSTVLPS